MRRIQCLAAAISISLIAGCQISPSPFNGSEQTEVTPNSSEPPPIESGELETGSVILYWSAPFQRVNGELMDDAEIGGYEIRYKEAMGSSYTTILIADAGTEQYLIENISSPDTHIFEVAVFDTEGIFSDFVSAVN